MANSATRGEFILPGVMPEPSVPVVLNLYVANAASGDDVYTGLVGRHEIIGFEVTTLSAGDALNTYTLKNNAGDTVASVTTGSADAGTVVAATSVLPTKSTAADGGSLTVSHVRNGGSSEARCRVWLLPLH